MKRPTLHDVAKAAGVSHMTVSRVVRGQRNVAAATVARVQKVVGKLGYRPDPLLSALAFYRAGQDRRSGASLAFLDCDGTAYSQSVFDGAMEEAQSLGYTVEKFRLEAKPESQKRLSRLLFNRGVRGLLFGPSDQAWNFVGWEWDQFAALSLGALSHSPPLHAVAADYFQDALSGYQILWGKGCRKIGLVVQNELEVRTGHRWLGGYAAALAPKEPLLVFGNVRQNLTGVQTWFRRHHIDGLLTIHSEIWKPARKMGIEVAFLNSFDTPAGALRLTFDPHRIGREGVRQIHPLLLREEFGLAAEPKMVTLPGAWN